METKICSTKIWNMDMDTVILIIVTLCAVFYLWRRFFSGNGGCSCGSDCSNCGDKKNRVYGLKEK